MRIAAFIFVMSASAAFAADKKAELIEAMNANGCKMTTAQANEQMPKLGIDRATAIALSREMMADGIAKFADDEETLLLLPPACKS
ncbi:hypothetical protein [Sulfitobacter donghicola]|uniref:NADH dehydrogenase subunit E n=1 Tax=Sulfitobacter donghicola DSW-25 = KCTC 12864 = JCM 14565 TaxID=1300350 RepID=A0A073IIS2_9RHOB|nr:hypothetical protein [Sulfitobacter donghicola]KEJ89654.1 hypothetical protein DSW25_10450 [Sulfitobacter donghicola DSW-25 = KCTC 12864 = JCM 14565]KIN69238.1 hypothetical protein Z948_2977 [Sulfitobacter donghicola DSW-25 = KCTC 12864 = JCM 14565]